MKKKSKKKKEIRFCDAGCGYKLSEEYADSETTCGACLDEKQDAPTEFYYSVVWSDKNGWELRDYDNGNECVYDGQKDSWRYSEEDELVDDMSRWNELLRMLDKMNSPKKITKKKKSGKKGKSRK